MRLRTSLIAAIFMATAATPSWSETFYVAARTAPATTVTPDGSQSKPWSTLSQALSNAKEGDTILLMDGPHGGLAVTGQIFNIPVTIQSLNAKNARLEWLAIGGTSRNIVFKNLKIWPTDPNNPGRGKMIESGSGATDIVFDGLDVRSGEDASTYPGWSLEKWGSRPYAGFQSRGARVTVKNSSFTGLATGIQTWGKDTLVFNNTVAGFSNDAMRVFGNNTVIRGNKVTDCVRIDGNHPDAIQSWAAGGVPVDGVVLDGNTLLEWSAPQSSPLRCRLQGIGFFDGFFDNLQITNNVIAITAYHGIAVYGGRNVAVVNNTVVNIEGGGTSYPWIRIVGHKNGTPSSDVVTANNLAHKFSYENIINRTGESNVVMLYPAKVLTDVTTFDYRPKADSGFIDTASVTYAPPTDILGNSRPSGKGPDLGAYEMNGTTPTTTTPTTTTPTTTTPEFKFSRNGAKRVKARER